MALLRSICCSLISLSFVSSLAIAELQVEKQLTTYAVEGNTSRAIRRSLDNRSPVTFNGKTYDAFTKWHVSWKYSSIKEDGACRLYDISTTVSIEQILPRLVRVTAAVRRSWERYYSALIDHENHHADFGRQAAEEVDQTLHSLPAMESCQELGRIVDATGRRIVDRYVYLEKQYDQRTNYGARQGAHFP